MESVGERSYSLSTEAKLVSRTSALAAPTLNHTTKPTVQIDILPQDILNWHITLKEVD